MLLAMTGIGRQQRFDLTDADDGGKGERIAKASVSKESEPSTVLPDDIKNTAPERLRGCFKVAKM